MRAKHKVTTPDSLIIQELELQHQRRLARIEDALEFLAALDDSPERHETKRLLLDAACRMHLEIDFETGTKAQVKSLVGPVLNRRALGVIRPFVMTPSDSRRSIRQSLTLRQQS